MITHSAVGVKKLGLHVFFHFMLQCILNLFFFTVLFLCFFSNLLIFVSLFLPNVPRASYFFTTQVPQKLIFLLSLLFSIQSHLLFSISCLTFHIFLTGYVIRNLQSPFS